MKNYVYKKESICIGKMDEIIKYLSYLSLHYTTIQEFIDSKQNILKGQKDS